MTSEEALQGCFLNASSEDTEEKRVLKRKEKKPAERKVENPKEESVPHSSEVYGSQDIQERTISESDVIAYQKRSSGRCKKKLTNMLVGLAESLNPFQEERQENRNSANSFTHLKRDERPQYQYDAYQNRSSKSSEKRKSTEDSNSSVMKRGGFVKKKREVQENPSQNLPVEDPDKDNETGGLWKN